jgi:hypothetical protein
LSILVSILAGLLVIAVALFVWGSQRLHLHGRQLADALGAVELEAIPGLAGTCAHVFASKLGTPLDSSDPIACARALDEAVRSLRGVGAFARPDLEWAYVVHCGAYLGELVRLHAGGRWERQPDGAPGLVVEHGEAAIRLWPFEKILKHRMQGDAGDLVAYVEVIVNGRERLMDAGTGTEG